MAHAACGALGVGGEFVVCIPRWIADVFGGVVRSAINLNQSFALV